MKKLITAVALFLMVPALGWAQNTDNQPRGLGYFFVGAATNQMGATAGLGGEGYVYKGLGVGAEVGAAGVTTSANGNANIIGVGSADLSYHFFPRKIKKYPAPFVTGGYTNFFGQDVFFVPYVGTGTGGNYTHGFNVGGGVDLFASRHVGVRGEIRYYGHGGRILWASFPNVAELSFVAFRFGVTFR